MTRRKSGNRSVHCAGRRVAARRAHLFAVGALLASVSSAAAQTHRYLLIAPEAAFTTEQVRASIVAAGLQGTVDVFPQFATPSLGDVLQYDAVLTYSTSIYSQPATIGDVLADYVDAGGGVVCAVRTVTSGTSYAPGGRWAAGNYRIIPAGPSDVFTATTLGTVFLPGHPLWSGMTGFAGGTDFRRAGTVDVAPHGVRIANWATGQVLVAISTLYPARVDLNFLPTAWHSTPDGARLLRNALAHAAANSNLSPGACCFDTGVCQELLPFDCWNFNGSFRGPDTTCATANCPQLGACCHPDGACTTLMEAACTTAGGVWQGPNTECWQIVCPQPEPGACCFPSGCTLQTVFQCVGAQGLFRGENVPCGSGCSDLHFESEPNNTRAEANAITLPVGMSIAGLTTGGLPTGGDPQNPDYFRVRTLPAAPGIYQHRLTLTSSVASHQVSIRVVDQTPAPAAPWPGPVGVATMIENHNNSQFAHIEPTGKVSTWYGFGRQEEVFYRVSGDSSTFHLYSARLSTEPVTPTNLGSFQSGMITISTGAMGHNSDTSLRIYDADLLPVHGYANDGASTNGGASTNTTIASHLRREFLPGTYYMALTIGNLATDQGAPCDDNRRNSAMLERPDVAVNAGGSTDTDVSFRIVDGTGTYPFPAARGGRGEIAWFRFDVTGSIETGACCFENGACEVLTPLACSGADGVYAGAATDCTTTSCPQPGACCLFLGCQILSESRCASMLGEYRGNSTACATANCPPPPGAAIPLPAFTSTLSTTPLSTYGLWFTAPTDFIITGLRVPDETGFGSQNVELVKMAAPPPAAPAVSNTHTSQVRRLGVPSAAVIPVNIPVAAGEIIGILGNRGNATQQHHSLGANSFQTSVLGQPAVLRLLRMGHNLTTTTARDLHEATGSTLARIEVYVTEAETCYANCDDSTTPPILNVDDFTCFINNFAAAQSMPHQQQVTAYANCDGSTVAPALNVDDFTCFINEFAAGCP